MSDSIVLQKSYRATYPPPYIPMGNFGQTSTAPRDIPKQYLIPIMIPPLKADVYHKTDIDQDVANMTEEEIIRLALDYFGMWKDREDIGDDWVKEMRSTSIDRLERIYGNENFSL